MTRSWVINISKALYTDFDKLLPRKTTSLSSRQQPRGDAALKAPFLTRFSVSGRLAFRACHCPVDLRTHTFLGRGASLAGDMPLPRQLRGQGLPLAFLLVSPPSQDGTTKVLASMGLIFLFLF